MSILLCNINIIYLYSSTKNRGVRPSRRVFLKRVSRELLWSRGGPGYNVLVIFSSIIENNNYLTIIDNMIWRYAEINKFRRFKNYNVVIGQR